MKQIEDLIIAEEGKILIRKIDNSILGKEITLGYTYYINGNLLTSPHKDTIDDFMEIDEPDIYEELQNSSYISELEKSKIQKRKEILLYDSSNEINEFYYQGIPCWLDKSTRVGLVNSTQMEIKLGRSETTLILNDLIVTLPCQLVLNLLAQLEVYAKDCYNVTAKHIINVNKLESINEVENYNFKVNYPAKLEF